MFQNIESNNPIQPISFYYSKYIMIILAWNKNKVYDRIRWYIQPSCVYENMSFSCSRCWISIYMTSRKNLFLLNCKHTWFIVRVFPANCFIWNVALIWATSIQFFQHICCCCSIISLAHIVLPIFAFNFTWLDVAEGYNIVVFVLVYGTFFRSTDIIIYIQIQNSAISNGNS